jgi:hypothetical protein
MVANEQIYNTLQLLNITFMYTQILQHTYTRKQMLFRIL